MKLYNTLHRKIEDFVPLEEGKAGMYACGPTVYNYPHIGNLRTYVFEDLLRRTLEYNGYRVNHVMNVTDVGHLTDDGDEGEDKMTKSAREKKMSVWEIADFYEKAFFEDIGKLEILKPHVVCRATNHIEDMIELIKRIEKNGYTYMAGGNVYFDISKSSNYGNLAMLDQQELKAGARVSVDKNKRNPGDFVLWFTRSKFEHQAMLWDSPWGKGYPGWHIECSAMSMKYLGEQFDIHCGGIDHIPVHHTNEMAQSEAATGKKWVNYWVHGEFLIMDTGKMAKSKGNFITLADIENMGFHPLDYRFLCLGAHYRAQLQFSYDSLKTARSARENLNGKVLELKKEENGGKTQGVGEKESDYLKAFKEYISNDLNIPRALAQLWGILKDERFTRSRRLYEAFEMDSVLGLGLADLEPARTELAEEEAELIREREEARKVKDYAKADKIRDVLLEKGLRIKDTPCGTEWERTK